MKITYAIVLWNGTDKRRRLYDTETEARAAADALRKQNLGYWLYELCDGRIQKTIGHRPAA